MKKVLIIAALLLICGAIYILNMEWHNDTASDGFVQIDAEQAENASLKESDAGEKTGEILSEKASGNLSIQSKEQPGTAIGKYFSEISYDTAAVSEAAAQEFDITGKYDRAELIRFHVVANSDTAADQQLKRDVRDAVIRVIQPHISRAANRQEAENIIFDYLHLMQQAAQSTVNMQGYDYKIAIDYGQFQFPDKSYGSFVLPAGVYQAVKIVVGEGLGENWWCVMFPPLCFVDLSQNTASFVQHNNDAETDAESNYANKKNDYEVKFAFKELLNKLL